MSIELLSILFVVVFVGILLAGVPLAFATGAVAVMFAYGLFGLPGLTLVISRVFTLMGNYVLVSVPLFIFMACILERAGVADSIFRAVHVWFGGVPRRPGRCGHLFLRADGHHGRRDRSRDRHDGRDRAAGHAEPGV